MPELSRFFGIIARMYLEAGVQHHTPHFHVYYQNEVAIYGIDPIELIAGGLPRRQQRMVEAWAELHQQELRDDWERLQAGQAPRPIAPLHKSSCMNHPFYKVRTVKIVAPYTLQVGFDDATVQTIDFSPVLAGEFYGPLREPGLFSQVKIDPEVHTLVWPNGADFDPATLHDWPQYADSLAERARQWAMQPA